MSGDVITVTAVSDYDSTYSSVTTVTVIPEPVYSYSVNVSKAQAMTGETVAVSIVTDMPNADSTITVNGNATYDIATSSLTINSDATSGDVITVTAVSNYRPAYSATTSITVVGEPTYVYSINVSKAEAMTGETVTISISTDMPTTASTITVSGNATYDATTNCITINNDAASGDVITISAVSDYRPAYSASTIVTVIPEPAYSYAVMTDKAEASTGETVVVYIVTDMPSSASTITVSGNATYDAATRTITIGSGATVGEIIEVTAVSDYRPAYSATTGITVIESTPSEIILISAKTADGTPYVYSFSNGPAGDANFAAGDYLEYSINFANETRAGELLGFGTNINVYNENLHFANEAIPSANKWVRWNSYVHTASSSGSIQKGLNANGTILYVQYKSDGIYYSMNGETYTQLDLGATQQALYEGWWEASIASASTLQVGWNYNNSHPNGTYYDYVKIVKNSTPTYSYEISASKSEAMPNDNVTITVDTNLASTATTFNIVGPATIDSSTGVLTIASTATTGSVVVVNATSSINPAYSATTSISVVAPVYSIEVDKTGATRNDTVIVSIDTNLASTASTFNVVGPASFDPSTMLLTVDATAVTETVITIEATSTVDNNYSASTTVTVTDSSETILWSNVALGSTPISRTLTNGEGGDINFAAGDYIEVKFDTTNETIGNARIFSFAPALEAYNNTFNIEKQMNGNSWVVFMGWFDMSTRVGFNPGYEFYARFTKDGVFYSSDGVTYTEAVLDDNPPTGAGTPHYRAWYANAVASSTIEVGHKYNNFPNGTIWKYVKIVKA